MSRLRLLLAALGFALLARPVHAAVQSLTVGSVTLAPCIRAYDGYCGYIPRPIDPTGAVPGTILIGFEFYPHTDRATPSAGTIAAQEGGPGYSTTGSRDGYVRLFTPLRDHRDILLIDKRGTGRSAPIDCRGLQHGGGLAAVAACGAQLGDRAWLYSSTYAADDMAAVLTALGTGPVDYYGDSYGTFFGEVFAARHPEKLRTVTLDSAYPVLGESPYFATEIANFSVSLERVCTRSPSCAALGPSTTQRFAALLTSLRAHPVSGRAPGGNGETRRVTADAGALFLIAANAGNNPTGYRDMDAAARAWLGPGDHLPLFRLIAEAEDSFGGNSLPGQFSTGLADAVQCADYKTLYDMRAPFETRRDQFAAAIAATEARDPGIYAPFTLPEALHAPLDPEALDTCLAWPTPPAPATPGFPVAPGTAFPKLPVLVLSGEIDTVTSPREGAWTTALFPTATFVVVRNTGHETAVGDGGVFVPPQGADLAGCAGPIVLNFIASDGDPGDTSCAVGVRPIRTVPAFATRAGAVEPPTALPGNAADIAGLALASSATEAVGDAVARYFVTTSGFDLGLRGGRMRLNATPVGYALHLDHWRWAEDQPVSGLIEWDQLDGSIVAHVVFTTPGHAGSLAIAWQDRESDAKASLVGEVDGKALVAERVAP